jgi:hypothetical protein
MLLDTFDVLEEFELVHKATMAQAIADMLEKDSVTSMSEVGAKAKFIDEIRTELVDDSYSDDVRYELNEMIQEMTRPKGLVHYAMRNGRVLCSASVTRKLTDSDNGTSYLVKRTGRFVSDDPEVVMQYRIGPAFMRLERSMSSLSELAADAQMRIPALGTHLPKAIRRAHQTIRAELPETTDQ